MPDSLTLRPPAHSCYDPLHLQIHSPRLARTPIIQTDGLHQQPTHVVPRYANSLDWICVDSTQLDVVGVAPLPLLEELTRHVAMPSVEWPSDHVSLCCDLAWRDSVWRDPADRQLHSKASKIRAPTQATAQAHATPWGAEGADGGSWVWRT